MSAPPVVTGHGQQRALLREKSKENQLDRNGCQQQDRDSDKGCFDVGQYHTVMDCYVCSLSFCFFSASVWINPLRITALASAQAWCNY